MTDPLALIIEDNRKLADIFALAVQNAGFEAEIIYNGDIASTRLGVTRPALVVLDLHLPHTSGEKILKQIRADERLVKTQVILATADDRRAERLRQEADLVLLKPIDFFQLRDLAARLRPSDTVMPDDEAV